MRKLTCGRSTWFVWAPPTPGELMVDDEATLTIQWPGGPIVYTLAARAPDPVTDVDPSDARTVTVTFPDADPPTDPPATVPPPGWPGWYPAPAMLCCDAQNQIPVNVLRVVSVDEGLLELSDPLPSGVNAGGVLRWAVGAVEIPSEDVPESPARPVAWTVTYDSERWGLPAGTVTDRGVLAVVRAPFATGLTDAMFRAQIPALATSPPAGQVSWAPLIGVAFEALVGRIEQDLPAGVYVDQLAGAQFRRAHALLTTILACDDMLARGVDRGELRDRAAADFEAEIKRAMNRPEWLDADDDGIATAGEAGAPQRSIPALSHVSEAGFLRMLAERERIGSDR